MVSVFSNTFIGGLPMDALSTSFRFLSDMMMILPLLSLLFEGNVLCFWNVHVVNCGCYSVEKKIERISTEHEEQE